jgi:8-oxo-dGTP diphosphatase
MNEARRTLRVTCAVVIDGDRILVTQRGERMKMPLKWEFPGGKVEDGEGDEACLHRELKEELDIGIRIIKSLQEQRFSYTEFDITLVPFLVNITEGEIRLREHKAFRWLTRRELIALDWAEADVPVLQEFLSTTY